MKRDVRFATSSYWDVCCTNNKNPGVSPVKQYYKIESADCQLATPDLTGQVSGGRITLSGRLVDARVVEDGGSLSLEVSNRIVSPPNRYQTKQPIVYMDSRHWDKDLGNGRVECVPLSRIRCKSKHEVYQEGEFAMVLTCPKNGTDTAYRRIGMIIEWSIHSKTLAEIQGYWDKNPNPFEVGGKEATITIL